MVQTTRAPLAVEHRDGYLNKTNIPFELGRELGHRANIGLIVLANDYTVEYELTRMFALDGVATYVTRIPMDPIVTVETLRAMEPTITRAAETILPGAKLDVVGYCCTSGTTAIGKETIFARIRDARPGVACTTPIVGGVAGAQALGLRKIALLTPYIEEVNLTMRAFIQDHGIAVPVMGTFNNPVDEEVRRISEPSLHAAILDLGHEDVDGVFVSCTSMHVTGVIAEAEAALGKPVMSSNQALGWHCLRLAGVNEPLEGYGRLLRL